MKQQAADARQISSGDRTLFPLIVMGGSETGFDAGEQSGPLIRDFAVIRHCVSGSGELQIGARRFSIAPGRTYAILAGDVATERVDSACPLRFLYVWIAGYQVSHLLGGLGVAPDSPFFPWEDNPAVCAYLEELIGQLSESAGGLSPLKRASLAYALLDELERQALPAPAQSGGEAEIQLQYIRSALYFMECNLNRRLTVTEIAAHVGLHRSYFSGLFNQIVGMPPLKYLIQLRLNKACDLMRYPNATPLNVANSLGLDPSALFRYFKRNFGMTPSQYQRSTLDAARRADEPKIQ